jgi:type IV pilus assembly protein PilM
MAKTYLGIDIGHDMLKVALVKGGMVKKTSAVAMPVNLMRDGRLTSVETMSEVLAQCLKDAHIRAGNGAVILSGEYTYLRTTTMPRMSPEQLTYNIPFEFSDYITGDLKDYLFDYAMIPDSPKKDNAPQNAEETDADAKQEASLHLLVASAPSDALADLRQVLRKVGVKMVKAAPAECAYISLIREYEARTGEKDKEYCILDLGYRAIRMYMFHGPRHVTTRVLDIGLSSLDNIIADARGVDTHLAHTYLLNNFEDCQNADYCRSAYDNISVELMRAMNFYRFSNPDSQVECVWLGGGGAEIPALRKSIADTLDMEIRMAGELLKGGDQIADGFDFVQAVGITLD